MDKEVLQQIITLFLRVNPQPSDQQFHALAESLGVDHETLEAISYEMLGETEDVLSDPVEEASTGMPSTAVPEDVASGIGGAGLYTGSAPSTSVSYGDDGVRGGSTHSPMGDEPDNGGSTHFSNEDAFDVLRINANARRVMADSQDVVDNPALDPNDLSLQDLASNDGDPTPADLGNQDATVDDGFDVADSGAGISSVVNDVLTDDGVPDETV